MGKAAKLLSRAERRAREAHWSVFAPGMLEVLSIGKGDMKIVVDSSTPEETDKARRLIEEMLRKGYGIYVETDKGPIRVKQFNPQRMTYLIVDEPDREKADGETLVEDPAAPPRAAKRAGKRATTREVPVSGSRATAVGRTAGG